MAATTTKGTCPACFRLMALDGKGNLARHGWREGGQRRVGVYGQAWHQGACFGVGWKPFEISPEGTIAYVKYLGTVKTGIENRLKYLATRPAIVIHMQTGWHQRKDTSYLPFEVRLHPGDPERSAYREDSHGLTPYGRIPSYEQAWKNEVLNWEHQYDAVKEEIDRDERRIADWSPGQLTEAARRPSGPMVHLAKTVEHSFPQIGGPPIVRTRQLAACGYYRMGFGKVRLSPDVEDVTCPKCLATLKKNRPRRSKRRRSR